MGSSPKSNNKSSTVGGAGTLWLLTTGCDSFNEFFIASSKNARSCHKEREKVANGKNVSHLIWKSTVSVKDRTSSALCGVSRAAIGVVTAAARSLSDRE